MNGYEGEASMEAETIDSAPAATETTPCHADQPNGPNGYPFLGCIREFARDPLAFVTRVGGEYDTVAQYDLAVYDIYQLNDPALVEHVMVLHNENYVTGDVFQTALQSIDADGLLTSEG